MKNAKIIFLILALFSNIFFIGLGNAWASEYSGLWWDPAKTGQGVSIIQNNNAICGAWYLYDSQGKDMWLVFSGRLTSTNTLKAGLYQYQGPDLGSQWDVNKLKNSSVGSVTITFSSPAGATMEYDLEGQNGSLNLQPFANDVAGLYWDTSKPGQGIGFFMEQGQIYLVWYLYDSDGRNMWLTSGSDLNLTNSQANLYEFTGPPLTGPWDVTKVVATPVGSISLGLPDSGKMPISYNVKGVSGQMDLVPFICEVPQCASDSSGVYEGTAPVANPDDEICGYFVKVIMELCDESISGYAVDNFGDGYIVAGTLDEKGDVSGTIYQEGDTQMEHPVGTFTGTASEDGISGTWNDVWGCRGTFNVEKNAS